MASGQGRKRASSTRSTSSSGKSTNRGRRTQPGRQGRTAQAEPMDAAIRNEILLIVFLALAVILFLCNFGIVGSIGDAVSDVMFGLFGLTAYVAPIIIFLAIAFGMSNVGLYAKCTLGCFGVFAALYIAVYLLTARAYYRIVDSAQR